MLCFCLLQLLLRGQREDACFDRPHNILNLNLYLRATPAAPSHGQAAGRECIPRVGASHFDESLDILWAEQLAMECSKTPIFQKLPSNTQSVLANRRASIDMASARIPVIVCHSKAALTLVTDKKTGQKELWPTSKADVPILDMPQGYCFPPLLNALA